MSDTKLFRLEEIGKHTSDTDLWFVKDGKVYDVSAFVDQHPGGVDTLMAVAGKDGSADFDAVGHSADAIEQLKGFYIGDVHPDELNKIEASVQLSKTNYFGIAIVLMLVAVIVFFIVRP